MKRIHVAQFRLEGVTEGLRVLRQCPGEHRWLLRIRLIETNGNERFEDIKTLSPCSQRDIRDLYEKSVGEICASEDGQPVLVAAGGFDLYLLQPLTTHKTKRVKRSKNNARRRA